MLDEHARAPQAAPGPAPVTIPVEEAARRLGWTPQQVRRALHHGNLRGFKPGLHRWTVVAQSVDDVRRYGAEGGLPPGLEAKLRRFSRLSAEMVSLSVEIQDDIAGLAR